MYDLFNLYQQPLGAVLLLLVISIWTLIWKGIALWFAGKNRQKAWFIVMLIFNTMGLLPIIYLIWFKPRETKVKEIKPAANGRFTKNTVSKKTVKKKTTKRQKK
ncbi:MAG: hypothetical protein KKH52_03565 [Nanoarchaeota archaeon]|nr:hypothetical protein [Nanoarchaeota archaeon]MBU1622255.1 hypothetical protein [Nanoarchaeota archaeon]MBU1974445.1 hypothetical protein [Nanoarchaeota archaeon]